MEIMDERLTTHFVVKKEVLSYARKLAFVCKDALCMFVGTVYVHRGCHDYLNGNLVLQLKDNLFVQFRYILNSMTDLFVQFEYNNTVHLR